MDRACAGLAVVIPTFNPDERLLQRVEMLCEHADLVVIAEDGSSPATTIALGARERPRNLVVLCGDENRGIASALNRGLLEILGRESISGILTLDQDTPLRSTDLIALYEAFNEAVDRCGRVGCVGPGSMGGSKYERSRSERFTPTPEIMQSGTIYNRLALLNVGRFREDLFIDCVDTEMCLRLRKCGYLVLVDQKVSLPHRLGSGRSLQVFGRTLFITEHQPWRRYYIARNRLALLARYALDEPWWALRSFRRLLVSIVIALVIESDRRQKAASTLKGICDVPATLRNLRAINSVDGTCSNFESLT